MSITVISTPNTQTAPAPVQAEAEKAASAEVVATPAPAVEKPADETLEASGSQDESKTDSAEVGDQEGEPEEKPNGRAAKKINKLLKQRTEARQEAEMWRKEALKARNEAQPPAPAVDSKAVSDGKPQEDKFETHSQYVEALTDWKLEQKLKERDAKSKEQSARTDEQRRLDAHLKRVEEFAKNHPDWDEVVEAFGQAPDSLAVHSVIVKSDLGPAMMAELAKDPAELKRICKLPWDEAVLELGVLKARIQDKDKPAPEPRTSKAPKPISPVNAGGAAVEKSIFTAKTQAEFEAAVREQSKRRSSWG
jgi:hypothetical protein